MTKASRHPVHASGLANAAALALGCKPRAPLESWTSSLVPASSLVLVPQEEALPPPEQREAEAGESVPSPAENEGDRETCRYPLSYRSREPLSLE